MGLDDDLQRLLRELQKDGQSARIPEIEEEVRRLKALIAKAGSTAEKEALEGVLGGFIKALARRYPGLARLAALIARSAEAGQALGRAIPIIGQALTIMDIVLYTPGQGEAGSIAIPFDAYELVDTLLVSGGDPESGQKCYYACVYKLIGHLTDGDDPDHLYHEAGDDDASEVAVFHEYDCDRPPPRALMGSICSKRIYIQTEL